MEVRTLFWAATCAHTADGGLPSCDNPVKTLSFRLLEQNATDCVAYKQQMHLMKSGGLKSKIKKNVASSQQHLPHIANAEWSKELFALQGSGETWKVLGLPEGLLIWEFGTHGLACVT